MKRLKLLKKYRPEIDPELFDFLRDVLLLRVRGAVRRRVCHAL